MLRLRREAVKEAQPEGTPERTGEAMADLLPDDTAAQKAYARDFVNKILDYTTRTFNKGDFGNGTYTVVLSLQPGGNDIWFGSKSSGQAPQLSVTAEDPNAR